MADLLTEEHLRLFWFFAMPGIIILYVRSQFLTGRMPAVSEGVLAYLVVSITYHAVLFPFAHDLYAKPIEGLALVLLWFCYILAGPAISGVLLGLSVQQGWLRALLVKLRLRTVHPIASAWDWRFSNCGDCFVLVVLKNGTTWAGYIGDKSFMSSIPTERDIFIEEVYELAEDDVWKPRISGVWLASGEVQSIEFWPNKRDDEGGEGLRPEDERGLRAAEEGLRAGTRPGQGEGGLHSHDLPGGYGSKDASQPGQRGQEQVTD